MSWSARVSCTAGKDKFCVDSNCSICGRFSNEEKCAGSFLPMCSGSCSQCCCRNLSTFSGASTRCRKLLNSCVKRLAPWQQQTGVVAMVTATVRFGVVLRSADLDCCPGPGPAATWPSGLSLLAGLMSGGNLARCPPLCLRCASRAWIGSWQFSFCSLPLQLSRCPYR